MTDFQTYLTLAVFAGVILAIAFDVVAMVLAALLGVSLLIVAGVFAAPGVVNITNMAAGPIALLYGGMVVARVLAPTGIFDWFWGSLNELAAVRRVDRRFDPSMAPERRQTLLAGWRRAVERSKGWAADET